MSNPCDDISKVYCKDEFKPLTVYSRDTYGIEHGKDLEETQYDTGLVLWSRKRVFSLSGSVTDNKSGGYWLYRTGFNDPIACYDHQVNYLAEVSEDYTTVDTTLLYEDMRTDTRVYKRVTQHLEFYCQSTQTAEFRTMWGSVYPHKLKVVDAPKTVTTKYIAIINGNMHTLKSTTVNSKRYTTDNPLILIYPNVQSLAQPMDADVIKYGFYDYHGDGWDGLATSDGGKDYYYPEWCREMGVDNSRDIRLKDARFNLLLTLEQDRTASTMGESAMMPDYTFPVGNCVRSRKGHTLASFLVAGDTATNLLYNKDGAQVNFMDEIYKEGSGKTLIFPVMGL